MEHQETVFLSKKLLGNSWKFSQVYRILQCPTTWYLGVPMDIPLGSQHGPQVQPCRPHSQAVVLPLNWPDANRNRISCGIDVEGTRNREKNFQRMNQCSTGEIRKKYEQIRNMIQNMIKSLQLRSMLSTHDLQSFGGGPWSKENQPQPENQNPGTQISINFFVFFQW